MESRPFPERTPTEMEDEVVELPATAELEQPSQDQEQHQQPVETPAVDAHPQQQPNCDAVEQCGGDLILAERASDERAVAAAAASAGAPDIRRSISGGVASLQVSTLPAAGPIGMRSRSRSSCGGSDDSELVASELVLQLQRLCQRQRQRSEERAFVRDVERVLLLLRVQPSSTSASDATSATFPSPHSSAMSNGVQQEPSALSPTVEAERRASVSSSSSTLSSTSSSTTFAAARHQLGRVAPTLAELDALLDCIADLFEHRNPGVRALAFEVVQLCLLRFGERLTPALRLKVFLRLETHPPGDFLLRQKALRALTQDGHHLEPFCVELGWLLLRLLEQSDAQRDLLALIQSILRRSPHALDRDKVIAISSVVSARCDVAWGRGDLDACRRYVAFFHVLATHDLAYAASTPACLRSLCCLVNADGHGTWSVLKLLLTGGSGFHVLRGLLQVLEHPHGVNSPWVLRGAVFFVGMSCWGSQRLAKFDDVAWAPILLALEQALQCCRGVVIFEVILALQRLIKKFGGTKASSSSSQSPDAAKTPAKLPPSSSHAAASAAPSSSATATSSTNRDRRLVVEWDIILRMFRTLRPWVSMTDEDGVEDAPHWTAGPDSRRTMEAAARGHHTAAIHPASEPLAHQQQLSVSIQQTRIPRELLDTLEAVEELVAQHRFAGDVDEFLSVLEAYLPHLSESSTLFLLRQRADAAHPGYHVDWLATLSATMRTFFSCYDAEGESLPMPCAVRLQALEVLQVNLWTSRNVCEDRVIEEVVIPTLGNVYEDVDAEVRCRGLGFVIEVARQLESVRFDTLLDILASAMTLSSHEDAQLVAASGIVSLFSSAFNHLPPARAVRMYDLLATTVETHRSRAVRRVALTCLLYVCEARATDGRLQWKDQRVRTSRFLFVSRRAARVNGSGTQSTVACVPVARALRALLTLVSAEPDAELFRMAVQGIKTMLENRVVLEDVDVSEVAAKVVASMDYRAFGRAAIADEIDRLLSDGTSGSEAGNTREGALVARGARPGEDSRRSGRPISVTDADLLRSLHSSARSARAISDGGDDTASFCASLRATAALLAKTRFLAMGLELLQLLVSYEAELHHHALHELIRCLVGALDLRLAVAEKDLFAGGAATDDAVKASSSSQEVLYHRDSVDDQADVSDPYVSGASLTSRVLSRFQASTSHGSLFHALSSSVNKSASSASLTASAAPARPTREDRARLQTFLRQLFETEFALLHSATTALSLLVLLAPTSVLAQLDEVLRCARGCVTTIEGDFRADAFGAVLELLRALVPILPGARVDDASTARKAVVETLLLGFEYAKSRQLAYMSFRLLCQVIHQSGRRERLTLATIAMPTLQQCACRANSLLAEAAVDFLMCFAYAQSTLAPAALCSRKFESLDPSIVAGDVSPSRSRSWVYKNSLLTITTTARGEALLVIRRANCTSRWELNLCQDQMLDALRANVVDDKAGNIPQLNLNDEHESAENDQLQESIVDEGDDGAQARLTGKDRMGFRHLTAATALPPLPAYDGIGGSPSSRQAEGDDGQERSPDKQLSVRVIHEGVEEVGNKEKQGNDAEGEKGELEDENDGMDAFALDDSSSGMPDTPHVTQKPLGVDDNSAKSSTNWSNGVASTSLDQDRYDPMYLMMQLFDLTVENRPQLLSDGPSLALGLSVLDRTPEYETHKIGLLYVRDGKQRTEAAVLGNMGGSLRYLRFLRGLGTFTKLEGLPGYTGGLDATTNSDGKFGLVYKDGCVQIMFHVATMMVPDSEIPDSSASSGMFASMKKKRHIGNDFVHVVFKECDEEYDVQTLSGQFNDVHIVIQPLNDLEYRTQVHVKPGIAPFGPLYGTQIVASAVISESVRLTCLNANLACQVFHQDLVGFAMNCEERLKQIKQLGLRLAMTDEWKLDT
ncbi:hypothetical protein BBJ28_00006371 [Nothophytophthora sp. Chile5]|nr:hypothetical protein BBJ28_00006371 [Nothophytophthora sp. Chile5]